MIDPVTIPEGTRGDWSVRRFVVTPEQSTLSAIRAAFKGRGYVPPGTYTELHHRSRGIVMSDTPDEIRDHNEIVRRAAGNVLINGLGIGMVLPAILRKPHVEKVTVVEIDQYIIDLVAPHYSNPQLDIVNASAYDFQPQKGIRYGAVWHDIWDTICTSNLPEMTRLKRKYGRRADWQGCWAERECHRRKHDGRYLMRW